MKLYQFAFLSLSAAILTACGGGGGGSDSAPSSSAAPPSYSYLDAGTYSSGCFVRTINPGSISAEINTFTIGSDRSVSVNTQQFTAPSGSTAPCAITGLVKDLTLNGKGNLLAGKKGITTGKTGSAELAEFTFEGFKLSKGSLTGSLPAFGTKTKAGFLVEGNKLYVLSGPREADGFPKSFSQIVYTKQ
jgi:hypothetical protein